jgi:hypothetical protein
MLFLANENFPLESIRKLRKAGYDVVSVSEDSPGIEDKEILFRNIDRLRFTAFLRY